MTRYLHVEQFAGHAATCSTNRRREPRFFTFDGVVHDGGAESALFDGRGRHAGTGVDLQQPRPEVLRQDEVGAVQLERVLKHIVQLERVIERHRSTCAVSFKNTTTSSEM